MTRLLYRLAERILKCRICLSGFPAQETSASGPEGDFSDFRDWEFSGQSFGEMT
ncbi:MAG: hypothetical protein R3C49_06665 [Planctomycetaceae bacterium]